MFDLKRFIKAQDSIWETVLTEIGNGRKRSHWMWYIFPQINGLGYSSTTKFYSIKSKDEAYAYLTHPILSERLRELLEILLKFEQKSVNDIFPYPDNLKFHSCLTLFASITEENDIYRKALIKFFTGKEDERTQRIIKERWE